MEKLVIGTVDLPKKQQFGKASRPGKPRVVPWPVTENTVRLGADMENLGFGTVDLPKKQQFRKASRPGKQRVIPWPVMEKRGSARCRHGETGVRNLRSAPKNSGSSRGS
jgi:hypothetical protein